MISERGYIDKKHPQRGAECVLLFGTITNLVRFINRRIHYICVHIIKHNKMKPKILTEKSTVEGCKFVQFYKYRNGHTVPIYDVLSTNALNQLIGHVKFDNAPYGNVYYRGVGGLYDNVLPSLMRNRARGVPDDLSNLLSSACNNPHLKKSLKLKDTIYPKKKEDHYINQKINRHNRYCVEALWQHYAGSTRFLDVVDNHWVALWMGIHDFVPHGKGYKFCKINKRSLSVMDIYENGINKDRAESDFNIYTYILLIAMPSYCNDRSGICETDEFVEVDLRKALPSIYLRPHAQHALLIRRRDKGNINRKAEYYDMASQVTAILRIRVDRVDKWLGNGTLLSKENLFPSPSIDQGYNNLLTYLDNYDKPFDIKKYY